MKRHLAAVAALVAAASGLTFAQAAPASATPLSIVISQCESTGGGSPSGLCSFQTSGGVGTITVTGTATGWSPMFVYHQSPYGLGNAHGPCQLHSQNSITVTAVDSTGAHASDSQSFSC